MGGKEQNIAKFEEIEAKLERRSEKVENTELDLWKQRRKQNENDKVKEKKEMNRGDKKRQ